MLGNTVLVRYGIQNELSDLRAHVCVLAQKVYVYRTEEGASFIRDLPPEMLRTVRTGMHTTAKGFPVSVSRLPCECVSVPSIWMNAVNFQENDSPTEKGNKAVQIVKALIKKNKLPLLKGATEEITDKELQIQGTDILVTLQTKIQVKCDYRGGIGADRCTGNLFLQTEECNPYRFT